MVLMSVEIEVRQGCGGRTYLSPEVLRNSPPLIHAWTPPKGPKCPQKAVHKSAPYVARTHKRDNKC